MRRSPSFALLTAAMLAACSHKPPVMPAAPRGGDLAHASAVPGRLIVRWKDPAAAASVMRRLGGKAREALGPEGAAAGALPEVVELPAGMDPAAFRAAAGEAIAWSEPDAVMRLVEPTRDEPDFDEAGKRKDARPARQWALAKVRAEAAWRITRGKPDVRIAIVDTGADLEHPDLRGQIAGSWRAAGWLGRLGLASARDENGHGTHCAGVAAAAGTPGGVSGLAPGCKLLIARALDAGGNGATSDVVRGIRWAVANGARVVSLSMGSEGDSRAMREAVADALAAGVVVVAAMGNEGKQLKNYPAALPGVIAVGATSSGDRPTKFSTRGPWISVAAPGAAILSTAPTYHVALNDDAEEKLTPKYGTLSGTSMAVPLVAGLAALVLSKHADWSPAQVKAAIERGATRLEGGFNPRTGHGRIDAARTLGAQAE